MKKESNFPNLEELEAMQKQLEEAAEFSRRESSRYEHRLPPVLYHVTKKQNAEKILREGLSPSLRMEGDKEVVSLTDDISFGKRVATETQHAETLEDLVVLEIDTTKLDRELAESFLEERNRDVLSATVQEKLKTENPKVLDEYLHEVHYDGEIPANAISPYRKGSDPNAEWHRKRVERDVMQEIAKKEQ